MILWLNGAFGAGKTQTAFALAKRLPGAYVYDPENLGFFLRDNLPAALRTDDFQDYPQWRRWNRELLAHLAQEYPGPILVPMTVTDAGYFRELTDGLPDFWHIILTAEAETILRRLRSRGEGKNSWAAQQIQRCVTAFALGETYLPGERLATDGLPLEEVAETVAAMAGLTLEQDTRTDWQKRWDRAKVWRAHIRR